MFICIYVCTLCGAIRKTKQNITNSMLIHFDFTMHIKVRMLVNNGPGNGETFHEY